MTQIVKHFSVLSIIQNSDPEDFYTRLSFRYFAKIIGCHLAEINAPIPVRLSQFVSKTTDENCILLDMEIDEMYHGLSEIIPSKPLKYAAHGGLTIMTKRNSLLPVSACSSMTIGPMQFSFECNFTIL